MCDQDIPPKWGKYGEIRLERKKYMFFDNIHCLKAIESCWNAFLFSFQAVKITKNDV